MAIDFSQEEITELIKITEAYMSETRIEARRTATSEYKETLHHEGNILKSVLIKLQAAEVTSKQAAS